MTEHAEPRQPDLDLDPEATKNLQGILNQPSHPSAAETNLAGAQEALRNRNPVRRKHRIPAMWEMPYLAYWLDEFWFHVANECTGGLMWNVHGEKYLNPPPFTPLDDQETPYVHQRPSNQ